MYLIILFNAVAAITMIARPAKSAVIPLVIKKELLIKYNSFKELTKSLILVLGPAIGGILAGMDLSGALAGIWGIQATFYILAILYLIAGIIGDIFTNRKATRKYRTQ